MKRLNKNIGFLLCATCIFCSCTTNIDSLDKQEIGFLDLPQVVQDTLITFLKRDGGSYPSVTFLGNDKDKYSVELLESGPFIDGRLITNKDNYKRYKISRGHPFPIIIYNGFAYHPINYNIYTSTVRNEKFMRYKLE